MKDLKGRVALVTGAASGIGLALAEVLGEAGMNLVLVDIDTEGLAARARELGAGRSGILTQVCDVADYPAVRDAVAATLDRFGRLDLICNNAGVGLEGPVGSWTSEGWAWVLNVNLMGVVNGVRAATPALKANPAGGHILNTASIGGITAAAHHGQYAASKFAVVGLSQALRDELAPDGIGVSVLCPGFVKSQIANSARTGPETLRRRQEWLMREGFEGEAKALFDMIARRVATGLDPRRVAEMARDAICDNAFYVLTETEFLPQVERRIGALRKAIDKVAQTTEVGGLGHG
jgi:NAD(P)-dependent dehydrogenase (short-subunit alcohol dehydrogenase family)